MTRGHSLPVELEQAAASALGDAVGLVDRIWDRDHTVWQEDPTEVADRLGWLDAPIAFAHQVDDLEAFARHAIDDGLEHVLLVGMGGSSLYPDVLARVLGASDGHPALHVLDSTDPAAVAHRHRTLPFDRTLLVAASKSGTTVETRSHLDYFWDVLTDLHGVEAGRFVVAITDPGSSLAELGYGRNFRGVFTNPPDIGGRFSALSHFGLVPAALLGVDLAPHVATAGSMRDRCRPADRDNPGLELGALLAAGARLGRDELTLVLPDGLAAFGDWVEQLVAESTGKGGVGILPVVAEPLGAPDVYDERRLFVAYGEHDHLDALAADGQAVVRLPAVAPGDLPAEVFRWEFATAVAGALLGINPFDQPDVAAAKDATAQVLEQGMPELAPRAPKELLTEVRPGDYVAILAYVDPGSEVVPRLRRVAASLRDEHTVPVTLGIGPRYLHSTGQLHKGGPDRGVFLVAVGEDDEDLAIPRRSYTFGELKRAQAAGDLAALRGRGLRAGLVDLDDLLATA